MAKATVLLDTYRWHETYGDPDSPIQEATRGETIDVADKELQRGLDMQPPGLSKGESASDEEFADQAPEIPDDLAEKSKKDLLALAGQLGLDTTGVETKDALVGLIAAAPGYERPQV